jgi:hypothetical protein
MKKDTAPRSAFDVALFALAGLGGLALAAVVAPSPLRLSLYKTDRLPSPALNYPQVAPELTPAEIAVITEHPLFNADRQKDPPPPVVTTFVSLDSYRLAGIVVTAESAIAVVERKASKSTVTVKIGDLLDGRTVKAITTDGVLLAGSGSSEVLKMPKISGASLTPDVATTFGGAGAKSVGTGIETKK